MSIKRNIWALPALSTLIFTVGVAVSSSFSLQALSSIRATQDVDYPLMDQSKALLAQVQAVTGALRDAVTEGDKSRMAQVGELAVKVRGMLQTIAAVPGQEAPAAQLGREFDAYYAAANTTTRIMLGIDKGDPNATIGTMQSAQKVMETHLQAAIAAAQGQFETGIARSADNVRKVMAITIAVAALVIVGLVTVSYFVVRAIWRQLGGEPEYAREIARAVADGDLSMSIAVDARDRSSLLAALKEMQTRLEGMAGNIMTSTRTITMASQDMASENTELASRTDKQVSSLEQTARSMGTLTDTVRQNAQSARTANDLADSASVVARQGGRVVGQVVATMQQINKSARNIVDIISVIDGIAFQTNILALNAAVEASRAGEQGRGFAVVATEVRNLAQRSALAAKEIKTLIDDSVNKITLGSQLVDQAGGTMNDIVSSVQRVTAIMGEITLASDAQNGGIQKINQAIGLIDEMTRRNSALVEQASISTRSLREQADRLGAAVAVFKLSDAAREPEASAA